MHRVLVVEDDPVSAMVIQHILTRRGGYDVLVTDNAATLLAQARQGAALVLMDVSLSATVYNGQKVDGIILTQLLRGDPQTAGIPVVLATAHAMHGDREDLLRRSGADAYVSKPIVDQQVFLRLLDSLVASGREKERHDGSL